MKDYNNDNFHIYANTSDDFQKRADVFEIQSRWVTSESINNIPRAYFSKRKTLGNSLDAGGGTGYLISLLVEKVPARSVTIVDISKKCL